MRLSDFLLNNGNFEERKRILQRKEANDAYKKNAIYTQAKKNPMLKILEDLLSGKTEKDLFEKDKALLNEESENLPVSSIEINQDNSLDTGVAEGELNGEGLGFDITLPSVAENASDEEEHVNRISFIQFNDFNSSESITNTADLMYEKTYTKARSSYTYQMLMAQNGFQLEEPRFSKIA